MPEATVQFSMADNSAIILPQLLEGQRKLFEGLQQLHEKLDSVVSQFRGEIDELKRENQCLKKDLQVMESRLNKQEQHSRSSNVVIYDVPGAAHENRAETESKVAKLARALKIDHKVVVAHRLTPNSGSPIVAVFESKAHAQEVLNIIRQSALTPSGIGLKSPGDGTAKDRKILARPHLCPALAQLLKAAAALKAEANWGWTKVITSKMEVQIYKGKDADGNVQPPLTVKSLEDVLKLRLQLVEQGTLPAISPVTHANEATKKRGWTGTEPRSTMGRKEKRML